MAAKPPSDEDRATPTGADGAVGLRSVMGSLTHAHLAAEVGRHLQTRYQACLNDALPDKLAALVRQLQEQEDGSALSGQR
jgi:hypothetical protein